MAEDEGLAPHQKAYFWRTRLQPIRTASEITAKIIIQPLQRIPLYQKIAKKVVELRLLGMTHKEIAKSLNVAKNTVIKACKFQKTLMDDSGR